MNSNQSRQPFKQWPANFKFAYILRVLGLFVGLSLVGAAIFAGWGSGEEYVMVGLLLFVCAVVVTFGPRWALNEQEEKAKRARAKQLRQELKRR